MSAKGSVAVDGGRLAYEEVGTGAPVVFLHAAIADHRQWDRELSEHSGRHRLVRYDLRGYGGSTPATAPYSNTDDLASLITHLGLERPVVVGCSMGGAIAIDLAIARPELVRGLLLAAPGLSGGPQPPFAPNEQDAFDYDDRKSTEILAAWNRGDPAAAFDSLRQLWCGALEGPTLELFRRMVDANREEVYADRSARLATRSPAAAGLLTRVRVPTTVLIGGRDNPSSGVFATRIAGSIPGARLVPVPRADHLVNLSAPAEFDRELMRVLGDSG